MPSSAANRLSSLPAQRDALAPPLGGWRALGTAVAHVIPPLLDRFTSGAGHAKGFAAQTGILGCGGIAAQATNVAAALQPADRVTFVVRDYGCLPEDHGSCGL
jgi:hypothetical protein